MDDIMHMHLPGQRRKAYARDQVGDDPEDVLQRKWLKWAYRRL
jgi:hypothetical protein